MNNVKNKKKGKINVTRTVTRELKKFHITYTQFLAIIFAMFNTINLFLLPLGQYGIIPLTAEAYIFVMMSIVFCSFLTSTILYKSGVFQEAVLQVFDLQEKIKYVRTSNWAHCNIAQKIQMSPEKLAEEKMKAARILGIEDVEGCL